MKCFYKYKFYWSFIFEVNLSESFWGDFSSFSQCVWNLKNHWGNKLKGFDEFNVKMKVIGKDFVSGNFFFLDALGITLSKIFTNNIFSLISVFSSGANFREELLNFEVLSEVEGVEANLNNTSVVNSLGVVITFADSFGDVAHDQNLFGFFSLVDGVIENEVENCLGGVLVDAWAKNRIDVLLKSGFISKLCELKVIIRAALYFLHKVGAHKIHVLQNLEWKLDCLSAQIFLNAHVSGYFVHKIQNLNQVLKSFRVLNLTLINENKWFSKLSFQNQQEGLNGFVDCFLLPSCDFISAVFREKLNILQQVILFRFSEDVINDLNLLEDSQPAVSGKVCELHLSVNLHSDRNVDKQKWEFLEILIILRLLHNFVQIVKILFTLILCSQFVERTDDIFYLGLGLFHWLDFNFLFLVDFG